MKKSPSVVAAALLAAALLPATIAPANAGAAGTHAAPNAVAGYTPTGDTVYRDGRVVTPNGSSFYPKDQKQSVACRNGSCGIYDSSRGYDGYRLGWNAGDAQNAAHRSGGRSS